MSRERARRESMQRQDVENTVFRMGLSSETDHVYLRKRRLIEGKAKCRRLKK
jgi:hypothetical protein